MLMHCIGSPLGRSLVRHHFDAEALLDISDSAGLCTDTSDCGSFEVSLKARVSKCSCSACQCLLCAKRLLSLKQTLLLTVTQIVFCAMGMLSAPTPPAF